MHHAWNLFASCFVGLLVSVTKMTSIKRSVFLLFADPKNGKKNRNTKSKKDEKANKKLECKLCNSVHITA